MANRTVPPARTVRSRDQDRNWVVSGVIRGTILAGLVFLLGGVFLYRNNWILPGVYVLGRDLSGYTTGEAADILRAQWHKQTIVLEAEDKTWAVPPDSLGLVLDADATVRLAHQQGRSLASLKEMRQAGGRTTIEPVWRLDPAAAQAALEALATQIYLAPKNAEVRLAGGQAEPVRALSGRALDVAATLAWLGDHAPEVVAGRRMPLTVVPVEPVVADVGSAVDQANALLDNRISIRLYDPVTNERFNWTVPREVLGDWLAVGLDPANPAQLKWDVDRGKVEAFVAEQGASLGGDRFVQPDQAVPAILEAIPQDEAEIRLRVYHRDRKHVVRAGETLSSIAVDYGIPYPWIVAAGASPTRTLSVGDVVNIPSQDAFLPLPAVENKRIAVSLGEQKMWAYEDGNLKWEWPVSTGINSSPTSPGIFQVQSHDPNAYASAWDLWMPYFVGIYRPAPNTSVMNGFHGFPSKGGRQIIWTSNLGRPITYGCILASTDNAKALYEWAEDGVVVEIRR